MLLNIFTKLLARIPRRLLTCAMLLIFLAMQTISLPVYALTTEQRKAIDSGIHYFNADSCQPINITAGDGSPEGARFPNLDPESMAKAIDRWILQKNPSSALKDLGSTIVAGASNSNINPFLIVAIARKESSLADPSDFNVRNGNNAFGRTATASQPNFQGARLWYKWSSVKASVDHSASENQNAAGGGDMASYINRQYGDQLDSSDLVALFLEYAPPSENNTDQYVAEVRNWVKELATLTSSQAVGTEGSTPTINNGCAGYGVPAGTFVFYAQNDPKWARYPFGSSDLATSGCGPTSVAMVVATLADRTVTPKETADFGTKNGAYIENRGSDWQKMLVDGPQNWGLKSENIGLDMGRAAEILQAGGLIIASGKGASPFTEGGHILVIRAINSAGDFILANTVPNLQQSRDQTFTSNQLLAAGLKTMFGVTK